MTLEDLLKSQELTLAINKFKRQKEDVWDIGIYGSLVRGKKDPNDVDFVIFLEKQKSIEDKLSLSQRFRENLKDVIKNSSVEVVSVEDFLDPSFMARQGILGESFLLYRKKYLADILGFKTCTIFKFGLGGLSNSQKTIFRYAINGRRRQKGVLPEVFGEKLGSGAVKIPVENTEKFKAFLETHKIAYKTETAMFYFFR